MRILLVHHNVNNTGDDAMVESTINQMSRTFPNCTIILESADPKVSERMFPKIKVVERLFSTKGINHVGQTMSIEFLYKNTPFLLKTFLAWVISYIFCLFKLNRSYYPILEEYKKADLILSVAGDSISEEYAWFFRFYEIWIINQLGKPIILYAQSVGPFTSKYTSRLAKRYLSLTAAIFARDQKTIDLLNKYEVKTNIYLTADLAIHLESSLNIRKLSQNLKPKFNKKTVGIVLRTSKYAAISDLEYHDYLSGMKEVIDNIYSKNFDIHFIASIPDDADTALVFSKKNSYNYPIVELYKFLPSEVKTILSEYKLVISPRMHPVILSSSMGVPVIGLGKEFKMFDYMKLMGLDEYFLQLLPFDAKKVNIITEKALVNSNEIKGLIETHIVQAKALSFKNSLLAKQVYEKFIK